MIKSMDMHGNITMQLITTLCLVLIGCSPKNDKTQSTLVESNELIQVSLSTDGIKRDTSGAFAIEFNKNLIVNYFGSSQSGLEGNYVGKIEQTDWNKFLKIIDHKQIRDTILSKSSFEDNYFDLSIKFRDQKHHINGFYSHAPKYIKEICELVLSTKKKTTFTKVHENHSFEVKAYKVKQKPNDTIHFTVPKK